MLTLDGLIIRQGSFALAADFTVTPGARVAVIGPSGAGKSTLLGAIGGFIPCTQGTIRWDGADIGRQPPGARPVAMLFQDHNLFPHLTVQQNVGLGCRPDLRLRDGDVARIQEALDRVGLADLASRRPGALSGGQQSRAALARVLVQEKPVVLLDEPFAALGPALRVEMLDLVAQLVRENDATLLMVTHDPKDAARIATDIVFVDAGRADPPTPAAALLENPPPALRTYLG